MDAFLFAYITRLVLYLFAAYFSARKRIWWLMITCLTAAFVGTLSFMTRDELVTGGVSNLLGLALLITALDLRPRPAGIKTFWLPKIKKTPKE